MDQNEKVGKNWPNLSPEAKLQQLRWFRDERKYGQDWFIKEVINEDLLQTYMNQIAFSNLS